MRYKEIELKKMKGFGFLFAITIVYNKLIILKKLLTEYFK